MHFPRLSLFLFLAGLYASPAHCVASPRALFQDELIREADTIAIVRIYKKEMPSITGQIPASSSTDVGLILYSAKTIQRIIGEIPDAPILIQFNNAGSDPNQFSEGTFLLFAKREGQFFRPLATDFQITDKMVFWFKKPFETGSLGPEMGMVPLTQALDEIKTLITKHKNANGPVHLTPTRRHAGCLVASLPASVAPTVRGR